MLKRYPGKNVSLFDKHEKLPKGLSEVWDQRGPSVYVRGPADDEVDKEPGYVIISWGSGVLGNWGLFVGAPSFVPNSPGPTNWIWKPGLYFWRDLH